MQRCEFAPAYAFANAAGHGLLNQKIQIAGFHSGYCVSEHGVSNTATPGNDVAQSACLIIAMTQSDNEDGLRRFGTAYCWRLPTPPVIGGIATLIGTLPTPCWQLILLDTQGIEVALAQWMLCLPGLLW